MEDASLNFDAVFVK